MNKEEIAKILNIDKFKERDCIQFCFKCIMSKNGWHAKELNDNEYCCPIAYDLQKEITCPMLIYQSRRKIKNMAMSIIDWESKINEKIISKIVYEQLDNNCVSENNDIDKN